jgi:predicted flap endonuclease-1-like 5' DNA nuclease
MLKEGKMDFLTGLVGGLLAGWLGEWVIDWFFWRRRAAPTGEDNALRDKLRSLETENRDLRARINVGPQVLEKVVTVERERLEDIYGIGPVFAGRLREAGVTTFAQLAEQNPNRVREWMAIEDWQVADPESWISQARDFAERRRAAP